MRKRLVDDLTKARYLTIAQACTYTNMGRNYLLKWCEEIGALRRLSPRMLRIDKDVLDAAMQKEQCYEKPRQQAIRSPWGAGKAIIRRITTTDEHIRRVRPSRNRVEPFL